MFYATYDDLRAVINPKEIIKITLNKIELEKYTTFELMTKIEINDIIDDLVFWTKDSRIDKIKEYDYEEDYSFAYYKETKLKPKTKIKVIPESLKETWKDPKTELYLPLKTKAYLEKEKKEEEKRKKEIEENNKRNYEKAKNIIENQIETTEKFEFTPFTIIEGGMYNACRYITLPKNFPIPNDDYYLDSTKFYKNMSQTKKYVDFVGLAGIKNNKPCIIFRYALNSLKDAKDLKALVDKAISENKFTPVLGISQEIIGGKDLDDIIQEIKMELENEQNNSKQ